MKVVTSLNSLLQGSMRGSNNLGGRIKPNTSFSLAMHRPKAIKTQLRWTLWRKRRKSRASRSMRSDCRAATYAKKNSKVSELLLIRPSAINYSCGNASLGHSTSWSSVEKRFFVGYKMLLQSGEAIHWAAQEVVDTCGGDSLGFTRSCWRVRKRFRRCYGNSVMGVAAFRVG